MRIRTIKPEFFLHEGLYAAEKETGLPLRISFIGLWCASDREGRFKWEPRKLGVQILPYDLVDFSRVLDALMTRGFVWRYRVDDACYGAIPSFTKHQVINNREKASELPEPLQILGSDACSTRDPRVTHAGKAEGKGREGNMEGKGRNSFAPNGTSSDSKPKESIAWNFESGFSGITDEDMNEWAIAYPALDLKAQIGRAGQWLKANPHKRKKQIRRFLTNWFNRSQERGGDAKANKPTGGTHAGIQENIEF